MNLPEALALMNEIDDAPQGRDWRTLVTTFDGVVFRVEAIDSETIQVLEDRAEFETAEEARAWLAGLSYPCGHCGELLQPGEDFCSSYVGDVHQHCHDEMTSEEYA